VKRFLLLTFFLSYWAAGAQWASAQATPTNTLTLTPTLTATSTPTQTPSPTPCTLTSASLSWAADDAGEIFINGNQADLCPSGCYVGVNNISIPVAWINPTGDNVVAAYVYSTDTVYSGATWLLTLNYSTCPSTYVVPGNCVVGQYLFDPNASTGLPSAGSFPANWNMVGYNDSSWSAPGTIGTTLPSVAFANELIPYPPGGTVPWLWGAANWLTVAVGDAWMFREHFQTGVSNCPVTQATSTPTPTATSTPTPAASGTPCALTSASLSWAADDAGEIFINGNQAALCPDGCWVGVNGISIPVSWINPTGDNVIAAYVYSVDTVYSGASWLLTLNYSNCPSSYVVPGNCLVDQYLFDPNASTGLPSAGSFPANWNMVGYNDSGWSAPGTIGTTLPPVAVANELIPYPPGGTVPWTWGAANWLTVTVGDAWMFRQHFQAGLPGCPGPNPPAYTGGNPPGQGTCFIYPSPVRGNQAALSYYMAESGQMDLKIWNENGELALKTRDRKPAGVQVTPFSPSGFTRGVYFYTVTLLYDSGNSERLKPGKFAVLP
jgi:hypothetical protein